MIQTFLSVAQQTAILFILIFTGFICSKKNFFSASTMRELSRFILYVVTPCVIIDSFHRPYDPAMLHNLGLAVLAALGVHICNIFISRLLIHDHDQSRQCVYQYAIIFANCGYMGLPLQQAILGSEGVFYGAAFIGVFNLVTWTYGLTLMTGGHEKINPLKIVLNPGNLSIIIGLLFFMTPLTLPSTIHIPVKCFTALNTPIPMIIIGYYLSQLTSLKPFCDFKTIVSAVAKLIISPIVAITGLYVLGFRDVLLVSMVISAAAPAAANTVMFSLLFRKDTSLAVSIVSITCLLSIITMPLIISAALYIA
ncbi:MAG: AEC family transporter [Spirochaetia bacterium]|nr:AEC family transporter [Spirochaetia bacterium]